jgi:hypothetical protein
VIGRISKDLSKWIEMILGYKLYGINVFIAMVKFYKHDGIYASTFETC